MSIPRRLALLAAAMMLTPTMSSAQWAAEPGTTVRNEFGPRIGDGATTCRGACGGGCHPANCEPRLYYECASPSHFTVVRTYDCGTHEGCRVHDDCLDECSRRYPGSGRDPGLPGIEEDWLDNWVEHAGDWNPMRNFYFGECSRDCHAEAAVEFGLEKTKSWARGHGPFDGRNVFEYTVDTPGQEEQWYRCPDGMRLVCEDGRARCEEGDEPGEGTPIGVTINYPGICNDPDVPLSLSAADVIGLQSPTVTWKVLSGPGSIDARSGRLTPHGEGKVVVEAVSVSDPQYRDQATVDFGDCECSFQATLSGDTNRGTVGGLFAVFSTRGQASIMGASGGGPEYWEDLANAAEMSQGLLGAVEGGDKNAPQEGLDALRRMADQRREATPGSTLGVVLIEGDSANPAPGGMGGAFKIDVLADGAIEPGFSGTLPVKRMALHTGEFAEEGGAPSFFLYDPESKDWPGEVTLMVYEYDGQWMQGTVTGDVVGGLIVGGERRARLHFSAEFTGGIYNPLRMENACLMAWAADAENEE